jgi:hypothetical protein
MIYAVHISDAASGLEKIVTVDAPTPEEACRRIERTGYRIVRVTVAPAGVAAGVVMNPPGPPAEPGPADRPESVARRRRDQARAAMIRQHNLVTLWPIAAGIASILWGLFQWQAGNDVRAFASAVLGVALSAYGALRRWTRDQGPWR